MKQSRIAISFFLLTAFARLGPAQTQFNPFPSRAFGQAVLQQIGVPTVVAPNLTDGRELNFPQSIALDTSVSPPIVYVADFLNDRVLAWKNSASLTKGDKADKVIGQRDFMLTLPKGPGTDLSTGLTFPNALAVDKSGNLYVVDSGNNRVVRYPKPFQQTGDLLLVDLVLGQKDINSRAANQGQTSPTEKTLNLTTSGGVFRSGLAFDAFGNLWVSDAGNNRVLRFRADLLGSSPSNDPAADIVLGQQDFATGTIPPNSFRNTKNFLNQPSGLAFDPAGRLFVCDGSNRVMVFETPLITGTPAARIMGVVLQQQGGPPPPTLNDTTLGAVVNGSFIPPEGVFFVGNSPWVADTGNSRLVKFDPYDLWPSETTAFSPPGKAVLGQPDLSSPTSNRQNQGLAQSSDVTVSNPVAAAFAGNDLYVVDAGNHRVLDFPLQGGIFINATRVLGQTEFRYNSPNLIEGRELFLASGVQQGNIVNGGGGVAVDSKSNPPHLYVADPFNNRVLGFRDYRTVNFSSTADLVLGQPDFFSALANYPSNDTNQLNDSGLNFPEGLAIDSNGDLWVADRLNGRVLRFPRPFDQGQKNLQRANLVIGQQSFTTKVTDASSSTMRQPYGIAFSADGHLVVSDPGLSRVLFFRRPGGGFTTNGQAATTVFGQRDFISTSELLFGAPLGISIDSGDRLFVADAPNSRILVFPNVHTAPTDQQPSFSLVQAAPNDSLHNPHSVFVDLNTGEIWVADTFGSRLLRFPKFETLSTNTNSTATLQTPTPLAVGLDPFGSPIALDGFANRLLFYYPAIDYTNAAGGVSGRFSGNAGNYFPRFAPGMLAAIFTFPGAQFTPNTVVSSTDPRPTILGDTQVFVGTIAAPLLFVSPGQINFQVPHATPTGQPVEIKVVRASTGQIVSSYLFRIDSVAPGMFTANATGTGQISALNEDYSINNGTHPAKPGSIIQMFGTGEGLVSGAPPDGSPAPLDHTVSTDQLPTVFINGTQVEVQFSGLAPGLVGCWQVNAKVPANVPAADVPVAILFHDINTRLDPSGVQRVTTIRTTTP